MSASTPARAGRQPGLYGLAGKRALDLLVVLGLALPLAPLGLLLALLVRLRLGSPVLFRQVRVGRYGRPFTLLKFRTMDEARGPGGELLPDADRLTGLGRWLRASSLDELPELLNVLRGDMSLVGPRPFLPDYLHLYTPEQTRRHEVPPGLTGWAQINGRHHIPFSRRFELDLWYVDRACLWMDLRILALTVPSVLASRGVDVTEKEEEVADLDTENHP